MKKKFKVSKRKKEKRHRIKIGRTVKADQGAEDAGSRIATERKQATGPHPVRSAEWTGSEEDSTLEILDRHGNRIPVHPDKELQVPPGPSDSIREDSELWPLEHKADYQLRFPLLTTACFLL